MMKKNRYSLLAGAAVLLLATCSISSSNSTAISSDSGSTDKTEFTWRTFPVFTQENTEDGVGPYEQKIIDAF